MHNMDHDANVRSLVEALGFNIKELDPLVYISESPDSREFRLDLHSKKLGADISVSISHRLLKKYMPT